jgi:hypothetical protein
VTRRVALKPLKSTLLSSLLVALAACGGPQGTPTDTAPATEAALAADLAEVDRLLNETKRVEAEVLPILDLAREAGERETTMRLQQIERAILLCGGEATEAPPDRPSALLAGVMGEPSSITCMYEQLASDRDAVTPSSLVASGDNPLAIEVRRPLYIASSPRLSEVLAPALDAHKALDAFVTRGVAALPQRGAPETDQARALAERVQVARDQLRERVSQLKPTANKVHPDLIVVPDLKDKLDALAVGLGAVTTLDANITRLVVRPDGIELDAAVSDARELKRAKALADDHPVKFGALAVAQTGPAVLPTWEGERSGGAGRIVEVRASDADGVALLVALWDKRSSLLQVGPSAHRVSGQAKGVPANLWQRLLAHKPELKGSVSALPKGRGKKVSLQLTEVPSDVLGMLLADVLGRNVAVAGGGPIVSVATSSAPADAVLAGIAARSDLRMRLHDSLITLSARDELPSIEAPRAGRLDFHVVDATAAESFGFLRAVTKAELTVPCDAGAPVRIQLRGVSPRQVARGIQVASGADPVVGALGKCAPTPWDLDVAPNQSNAVLIGISQGKGAAALVRVRGAGSHIVRDGDSLPGGIKARVGAGRLELYRGKTFVESFALTLAAPFRPTAAHRLTATITGGDQAVAIFRDTHGRSHTLQKGFLGDGESLKIEPGTVELRYDRDVFGRTEKVVARWRL